MRKTEYSLKMGEFKEFEVRIHLHLNLDSMGKLIGPLRVWDLNKLEVGLSLTRSLGDEVATQIGVSSVP